MEGGETGREERTKTFHIQSEAARQLGKFVFPTVMEVLIQRGSSNDSGLSVHSLLLTLMGNLFFGMRI